MKKYQWKENYSDHTTKEVYQACQDFLKSEGLDADLDYFSPLSTLHNGSERVPDNTRWIACFVVAGGSEGHYIHVDLVVSCDDPKIDYHHKMFLLGKTLLGGASGSHYAYEVAEGLSRFLGAID